MKKITLLFIFFIATGFAGYAQPVSGYLFSQSTEAYSAVTGINSTAIGDDGTEDNINIGFPFNFAGTMYNTFSISTNGFIRLGNAVAGNSWINGLDNASGQAPLIAAFWDDNNRNGGSIQYAVSGSAPNRTLEVGWNQINTEGAGQTNNAVSSSFKLRLHETTGVIEFIYGSMVSTEGTTASIGLNDTASFLSVSPVSGSATTSSVISDNAIAAGQLTPGNKYTFTPAPQCSGIPAPGNTLASASAVCQNEIVYLSLENQSSGFGIGYQWQSSINGINYSDIIGETSSALTLTQTATTYYRCNVSCAASGQTTASTPVQILQNAQSTCFCTPTYDFGKTDGDMISNVVITGTDLSNNTGTDPVNPAYTYFSGQSNYTATLQAGISYQIQVTVGSYGQQNSAVWIDYNDDHQFSDAEKVGYTVAEVDSFGTAEYSILLDCNAPAGVHRMRIRDVWNTPGSTLDPCANYGYGETEDYDITILAGASCPQPYALGIGQVNAFSAELQWSSGCGQTSWDVHVTTAGGGLPSGAASNPGITTNPLIVSGLTASTNYEFYVLAHCDGNGDSTWAGPFPFTTGPEPVGNDECQTAFSLTTGGTFDEHAIVATNAGATKSIGPPAPTCAIFGFGGDVWFSVVVPASGNITVETQADPGSPLLDTGLMVFSGTCDALTSLGCNDDVGPTSFSKLSLTGLTPGQTLYARVWEYANDTFGTFRVSAYDASLGNGSFDLEGFAYYPNPVKNILNLSYTQTISEVRVFNMIGQEVLAKAIGSNLSQIDMSALSKGAYLVKVLAGNQIKTIKVIKE